jgi:hypothetical protein
MRARSRRLAVMTAALAMAALSTLVVRGAGPKFYRDDPLPREPETVSATNVQFKDVDLIPDLLLHMFTKRGDSAPNVRAKDVNTIDEVPDSSWFTNRIYAHELSVEQIVEGQIADAAPASGQWTLIRPKSAGFSPGFTARDSKGVVWFLSFDPKGYPGVHRRGCRRDAAVLGSRLQPGRIVHHPHRSEADRHRPDGDDLAASG